MCVCVCVCVCLIFLVYTFVNGMKWKSNFTSFSQPQTLNIPYFTPLFGRTFHTLLVIGYLQNVILLCKWKHYCSFCYL